MGCTDEAVIPANAGILSLGLCALGECRCAIGQWIPAFAGMTGFVTRSAEVRR